MGVVRLSAKRVCVEYVEKHLRKADVAERAAVGEAQGSTPSLYFASQKARYSGVLYPIDKRGGLYGLPVLVYGCTDDPKGNAGYGVCWMMGTDEISKHSLSILRFARKEIARWLEHYAVIYNFVDTRNVLHVRWLKLLGFTLGEPVRVGGVLFQFFFKARG